jgi:hypothetical protein
MCCRGCSRIGSLKDSRALLEALAPSPWPKPFSKRLQDCCHRQGYKLSCASLQGTKCAGTCHMAMDSIWQQPPLVNLPRVHSYEHHMQPQTRTSLLVLLLWLTPFIRLLLLIPVWRPRQWWVPPSPCASHSSCRAGNNTQRQWAD